MMTAAERQSGGDVLQVLKKKKKKLKISFRLAATLTGGSRHVWAVLSVSIGEAAFRP